MLDVEHLEQVYYWAAELGDAPLRRWARDLLFPSRYVSRLAPLSPEMRASYVRQAEAAGRIEAAYIRAMRDA